MPHRLSFVLITGAVILVGCGGSHANHSTPSSTPTSAGNGTTSTVSRTPSKPFLSGLSSISTLGSTVPANGDVNPYGVVAVKSSAGKLVAGDLLVSNFNDKANNQGTGTTIDEISTSGKLAVFATINAKASLERAPAESV